MARWWLHLLVAAVAEGEEEALEDIRLPAADSEEAPPEVASVAEDVEEEDPAEEEAAEVEKPTVARHQRSKLPANPPRKTCLDAGVTSSD